MWASGPFRKYSHECAVKPIDWYKGILFYLRAPVMMSQKVNHCYFLLDHASGWNVFTASRSLTEVLYILQGFYQVFLSVWKIYQVSPPSHSLCHLLRTSWYSTNIENLWQWFFYLLYIPVFPLNDDVSSHVMMIHWTISLIFPWLSVSIHVLYVHFTWQLMSTASSRIFS